MRVLPPYQTDQPFIALIMVATRKSETSIYFNETVIFITEQLKHVSIFPSSEVLLRY
jgi:hypothetical protein